MLFHKIFLSTREATGRDGIYIRIIHKNLHSALSGDGTVMIPDGSDARGDEASDDAEVVRVGRRVGPELRVVVRWPS